MSTGCVKKSWRNWKKERGRNKEMEETKSGYSQQVKQSINGDEYYTMQNAVDMIVPYVVRGGTRQYGVLLTRQTVSL